MLQAKNSFEVLIKDVDTGSVIESLSKCTYAEVSYNKLILYFEMTDDTLDILDQFISDSTEVYIIINFYRNDGALFVARTKDADTPYQLEHYELILDKTLAETMKVRAIFYDNRV